MAKHAEFDVILPWKGDGRFDLTILFNAPGDIEDYQYFSATPIQVDMDRLDGLRDDVKGYGIALGQLLFPQGASSYLDRALRLAQEMPVYMRLMVGDDAPLRYRTIQWETLCHPISGVRMTTSENIRFCRYLSNPDGTPPSSLGLRNKLAALVVVANPAGIEGHADGLSQLSPVNMDKELARAKTALQGMSVRVLCDEGKRATAANIVDAIREREVNALYLVCHGMLNEDGPVLFLENERGNVARVNGAELAERIGDLKQRVPTLAVLVSCQSAGPGYDAPAAPDTASSPEAAKEAVAESARSLTAFGPALSRAGCAAVVAMQGDISMGTAARFMPKFFQELKKDGIAAHAMAVARSYISDERDWFVPVLYSRLKRGSAWYLPRFGRQAATRFDNLHTRIAEGNCTPIVGSGLAAEDGLLPTREKVASDWATRRQIPILDHAKTDLASVAQYVAVDSDDRAVARDELAQYLRSYLKTEYSADLPGIDWRQGDLDAHIQVVGKFKRRASGGQDCYSRLARLNLPIFITTSWNSTLEDALREAEKEPVTGHFEWYRNPPSVLLVDEEFSVEKPLVYHLFGTFTNRKSLVLSEDDYFAWLRSWMKQVDKGVGIPDCIKPPLMDNSLMFLGYGFDDWEFRMIFQAIKGFEGSGQPFSRHVGVQFEPGVLRIEPEAAQEYLEEYLGADHLDVYWGSCAEFLKELAETRPDHD